MKRKVFGIPIRIGNTEEAVSMLCSEREKLSGKYITFVNVHALMMSREDPAYKKAQQEAAYAMPDGNPVAWLLRRRGFLRAKQIAGPDVMGRMLEKVAGAKHYFYGGTQETLDALRERISECYPQARIVGMVSPPFRELTEEEDAEEIRRMNESGADYIWIALGAPKQELYMQRMQGRAKGVMLGVGAAFDFIAGTTERAPAWMRRCGIEWLHRFLSDPKRLWRRYLKTNTEFILTMPGYFLRRALKQSETKEK